MGGMKYFGGSKQSFLEEVPVPVGEICCHCDEAIAEGDSGFIYANGPIAHKCCFLRGVFGSVAHIEKRCSCYVPGAECTDPPGMTEREAAEAAVKAWYKAEGRLIEFKWREED